MKHHVLIGQVDYSALVFIPDPASTDGSGKTGLVAANLTVSGTRVETDNDIVITDYTSSLNDLAALTTAHTDWGIKEVSNTLAPGLYRIDFADAIFASGAWSAVVYVMITTSAAAASPMEFVLVAYNQFDGVRLGLTALPNAAADAAGGLPISDAGGLDMDAILSRIGAPSDLGSGASLAKNLVDVENQTDDIGAAGAGLTALATAAELAKVPKSDGTATWNATALAAIQSEANDALVAYDPPTHAELTSEINDVQTDIAAVPTAAENADQVWDEAIAGHLGAGSTGAALNGAGSAGDPWTTPLPGAYGAGTAGKIVGDYINATISSRASQTSVDTIDDFLDTEIAAILAAVDTEIAAILADTNELQVDWVNGGRLDLLIDAIKAKTDALPADPADASDIATSFSGVNTKLDTIDDFLDTEMAAVLAAVDTEIAAILVDTNELQVDWTNGGRLDLLIDAIKAKTDALPSDPADESSIQASIAAVSAFLDTEVAAILAAVDTEVAAIKAKTDNLPSVIKKNTELVAFEFLMVDGTDFATPETGVSITATRSIDGGAFSACTNAATEVGGGIYKITLSAADTNGTVITYKFAGTGCADRFVTVVTNT